MSLIRTGSRRNARRVSSMMRLEMLETRQLLATFTVLNTNDLGTDSLRAAIAGVNASGDTTNLINFNITGSGVHTINLASPLDAIVKQVTIDGTNGNSTPSIELNGTGAGANADGLTIAGGASSVSGLIINRFTGNGIVISNIGGDTVTNTWVGVNNTDTAISANGGDGIYINNVPNNFIGGTASGAKNVISGNTGNGVHLTGAAAQNNVIENDAIGTNLAGTLNLGNTGDGVHIDSSSSNNSVGGVATNQGNTIAFNTGSGVNVVAGTGNNIRRNSIFTNTTLGITLGSGANNNQPAPTLTAATTSGGVTTVAGTINATASSTYTIELFSNTTPDPSGKGQGRTYIGTTTVTTNASGVGTFSVATLTPVAVNQYVSSTATDTTGDTSAFSNNVQNVAPTADVAITGTSSPNPVANGGYLVYTFTITNAGPNSASNVTFLDTLPTGTSFVQAVATQGTVTRSSGVVTGTLGSLAPNGTATVTITVVPTAVNASLTNTGTVTASEDSTTGNNSATVTTAVVSGINLGVTATTNPPSPTVGSPLTFIFTVTNSGSVPATNVVLTSQLPTSGVTFTSTSATQGTSTASNGTVTANLGTLAVGASAQVYVVFNPTTTGTVTESASVTGAEPEINTTTQTTSATATVAAAPTPPSVTDGPIVTYLERYGIHAKQTSIQLMFNQALKATTAEDLANYTLVYSGKHPKTIRLRNAKYDPLTQSVILNTRRPVNLHKHVQLTINGTSTTGVANVNGVLLDGANNGKPGSNFVYDFKGFGPGTLS